MRRTLCVSLRPVHPNESCSGMSALEERRRSIEWQLWAQNRPWRSKASSPLSTQCSRASWAAGCPIVGEKGAFQQQRGTGGRFEHRSDGARGCGLACATWMALCTGSALALPWSSRPDP